MTDINKESFDDHLKGIIKPNATDHDQILNQLLDDVRKIDYFEKGIEPLKKKLQALNLSDDINKTIQAVKIQKNQGKPTVESVCKHLIEACKIEKPDQKLIKELIEGKFDQSDIKQYEDFQAVQNSIENFKLSERHYLIITIEEIIHLTKSKKWGLCKSQGFIYLYNGAYWKSIDKEAFQMFLGEASEKMGVGKFKARYYEFREKLFKQFISSQYFPTPPRAKDKVLINLLNGTFEVSDKPILRLFHASDFIKYQLPFEFDEKATAPKFHAYLDRVLPEKDKQAVLSEFLGYVFVPQSHLKLEKALFLYGSGANGKSVFYEIMKALLGPHNTSEFTLQSLTDTTGYYRALIADKLVNYASEISGKLESTKFKSLASGEPMEARLPYGQPMIIENYAKLIFNTNELPKDVEFNNAFFRRFIIIPFEVTIPEHEQNKTLHKEIIEEELPGVFNWVLDGLKRLLKQKGFSQSPSIDKALDEFRTESDTVKRFLDEEGYKPHAENKILLKDIFSEYREFALDDGNRPLSKQNFNKRLKSLKIYVNKETYCGISGVYVYLSKEASGYGKDTF